MSPLFKLLVWIFLGIISGWYLRLRRIFIGLAILGFFQSLVGFFQFVFHKSLGLYFLGESFLSPLNGELARVFIGGGRLLRAYGTFPHPNILAAFLVLSLLSTYFLYRKKFFILFLFLIFINWLGLVLTFSRAGWIIGLMVSIIFFITNRNKDLFFIILTTLAILCLIFYWAILPRIEISYKNFSIQNRLSDYHFAWEKIKEKPWLGHGLTLAVGERPIHNLYLTVAVETGLIGLSVFLTFIFYIIFLNSKFLIHQPEADPPWADNSSPEKNTLLIIFFGLLLFGLTDHFLWTLRPGLAMFWLIAGSLLTNRVWRK